MVDHICHLGDIISVKGHKFRIRAYMRLADFEPEIQMEYIGEVDDKNGDD